MINQQPYNWLERFNQAANFASRGAFYLYTCSLLLKQSTESARIMQTTCTVGLASIAAAAATAIKLSPMAPQSPNPLLEKSITVTVLTAITLAATHHIKSMTAASGIADLTAACLAATAAVVMGVVAVGNQNELIRKKVTPITLGLVAATALLAGKEKGEFIITATGGVVIASALIADLQGVPRLKMISALAQGFFIGSAAARATNAVELALYLSTNAFFFQTMGKAPLLAMAAATLAGASIELIVGKSE